MADQLPTSAEYQVLTQGCGILDRSERGKLLLAGADARGFLHGQVSNDIERLEPGEGCYAALLTPKGKMLADLRVVRLPDAPGGPEAAGGGGGGERLWLDTERSALQSLFDAMRRFSLGHQVTVHKRTLERVLISLIGPLVDDTLQAAGATAPELPATTEHSATTTKLDAVACLLIRTDVGVDVITAAEDAGELTAILTTAGARPVSEAAAEVLRIERGRPRYDIDLDDSVIPQEAGLNDRAVSFTKGCYVGQETVARLYYKGKPNRALRGLRLSAPAPSGAELWQDERLVGHLRSTVVSPRLGPIGLALLRREVEPGSSLRVAAEAGSAGGGAGATDVAAEREAARATTATVIELPFA